MTDALYLKHDMCCRTRTAIQRNSVILWFHPTEDGSSPSVLQQQLCYHLGAFKVSHAKGSSFRTLLCSGICRRTKCDLNSQLGTIQKLTTKHNTFTDYLELYILTVWKFRILFFPEILLFMYSQGAQKIHFQNNFYYILLCILLRNTSAILTHTAFGNR